MKQADGSAIYDPGVSHVISTLAHKAADLLRIRQSPRRGPLIARPASSMDCGRCQYKLLRIWSHNAAIARFLCGSIGCKLHQIAEHPRWFFFTAVAG